MILNSTLSCLACRWRRAVAIHAGHRWRGLGELAIGFTIVLAHVAVITAIAARLSPPHN
jgi:hypothetical protein